MGKDSTAKTVLIVGGVGLGIYFLANSSIRNQIKEAIEKLTGGLPGGGGGIGDIDFPDITLPDFSLPSFEIEMPDLAGITDLFTGLDVSAGLGPLGDLVGDLSDLLKPGPETSVSGPEEHATWADVAYSLPPWAKGASAVGITGLAAYGGYQAIRISAPALRALGTQAARSVSGAGNIIANVFRTGGQAAAARPATQLAARAAPAAARGGIFAGLLPGLALGGILEGAWQIGQTIKGAEVVNFTGIPPLDLINFIRGKLQLGPGTTPAPGLFDFLFGGLFQSAGAQEPAAIGAAPGVGGYGGGPSPGGGGGASTSSWCEAWGPEPVEITASKTISTAPKSTISTATAFPKLTVAQEQDLVSTIKQQSPDLAPGAAEKSVSAFQRYAGAMQNLGY